MAPDENAAVITEPVVVDIRSVDKELTSLWRAAAEGGLPGVSASVTRVLLSNLLVYARTDAEADEAEQVIAEMAADHPTRAVIADAQPGKAEHNLNAGISVLCSASGRGARLCGEEIRIHAHDADEAALGSIIPLLAPDLPIYLWTPGQIDTDDPVVHSLARFTDHWIIDSRKSEQWGEILESAGSVCLGSSPAIGLHDLAWTEAFHWREAVAAMFDAVPARQYLNGITSIAIAGKSDPNDRPSPEAVMLAAWIVRGLGWTEPVVRHEQDEWNVPAKADNREVIIGLQERSSDQAISQIIIESETEGKHATFTVAAGPEELTTTVDAPDLPGGRRTVRLASTSRCENVCRVLDTPGRDRLFEEALPIIGSIARQIQDILRK